MSGLEFSCAECYGDQDVAFSANSVSEMERHILAAHPSYTPEEARAHAQLWYDDAYEQWELNDMDWGRFS